jgi:hypothetical protein
MMQLFRDRSLPGHWRKRPLVPFPASAKLLSNRVSSLMLNFSGLVEKLIFREGTSGRLRQHHVPGAFTGLLFTAN